MNLTTAMEALDLSEKDIGKHDDDFPKHDISYIEGIGEKYVERFKKIGINNTAGFLILGSKRKGREAIARKMGLEPTVILKWANQADLYRIHGVGEQYGELLEMSGVDTVIELATRVPENLHKKMVEINEEKELVRTLPSLEDVEKWVSEAKQMPRMIEH